MLEELRTEMKLLDSNREQQTKRISEDCSHVTDEWSKKMNKVLQQLRSRYSLHYLVIFFRCSQFFLAVGNENNEKGSDGADVKRIRFFEKRNEGM